MRISNSHQFTEHHRYYTYRSFSLCPIGYKSLQLIYLPMVGAAAVSLYQLLYHQVQGDRTGYSALEPQRLLFLNLGIEMNAAGRQQLAAHASRLEAVGLLQTSRLAIPSGGECMYEYELAAPLAPAEFFNNHHLMLLLRDRIGKHAIIALKESFYQPEPDELALAELNKENISVPFYELFQLNAHTIDNELEQALSEVAPARQQPARAPETAGIQYGDIILRFPRNSANRGYVELLRGNEDQLAFINFVAYKYGLTVIDLCRLLDEDGIFTPYGELLEDELQLRANQVYRQERKRSDDRQRQLGRSRGAGEEQEAPEEVAVPEEYYLEVPAQLKGRCDVPQYNMLMRNEPYTRFLQRFFPGSIPDWMDRLFERFDLNYRLPGAVINVLIHYVLGANDSGRVTRPYIDAVASNLLVKGIQTFEQAVLYVREQEQIERSKLQRAEKQGGYSRSGSSAGSGKTAAGGGRRKPVIPIIQDTPQQAAITEEELAEMHRLARKLDGRG